MENATPPAIPLTCDAIQHIGEYLNVEEYSSFIEAVWPNGGENSSVRKHIWALSTHKLRLKFWNGGHVDVGYNFNAARRPKSRVILFETVSLYGIMGKKKTPQLNDWSTLSELRNYITTNVNLHRCPRRFRCENHFHHGSPRSIVMWLQHYARRAIVCYELNKRFGRSICYEFPFNRRDFIRQGVTDERVRRFMQNYGQCLWYY